MEPLPRCIGLSLLNGHAKIPMLLFTLPDWFVVAVVAVVLESDKLPKVDGLLFLLAIFRGGALPFLSELVKLPPPIPSYLLCGYRQ